MRANSPSAWWLELRQTPKLICLARTFPKHAQELGNQVPASPLYFLKSPSAIIASGDTVLLPPSSSEVHHESEIAVVLKTKLQHGSEEEAKQSIAGYTVLNDVTARDVQRAEDGRFCRAKSFDTFCPMSDELLVIDDWTRLSVGCSVNGEEKQHGSLTEMFMSPYQLLAWLSAQLTLSVGDVVALGTPPGVGTLTHGDELRTTLFLDGAAHLNITNPVRDLGVRPKGGIRA